MAGLELELYTKKEQNKSHNISTQNRLCDFTSKNGCIALFGAGSI